MHDIPVHNALGHREDGEATVITFRQAGRAVEMTIGQPEIAAHLRGVLWAYTVQPGPAPDGSEPIRIGLHHACGTDPARLMACPDAHRIEVGPDQHAAVVVTGHGARWFGIADPPLLVRATADGHTVQAYAPTLYPLRHWAARLVRQAMTAQLLADGAVYAHAAAARINGHGVVIAGPRGAGKTSTLLAALQHLGADYVTNDRLLLTFDGCEVAGHPWPDRMRAGAGMLAATPPLTHLLPAPLRQIPAARLWNHRNKITIWPDQLPQLLNGGTLATSCTPRLLIWPTLEPGRATTTSTPLPGGTVQRTLETTALFMRNADGSPASVVNHWLFPVPPADTAARHRHAIITALTRQARCVTLQTGGNPHGLAAELAALTTGRAL